MITVWSSLHFSDTLFGYSDYTTRGHFSEEHFEIYFRNFCIWTCWLLIEHQRCIIKYFLLFPTFFYIWMINCPTRGSFLWKQSWPFPCNIILWKLDMKHDILLKLSTLANHIIWCALKFDAHTTRGLFSKEYFWPFYIRIHYQLFDY